MIGAFLKNSGALPSFASRSDRTSMRSDERSLRIGSVMDPDLRSTAADEAAAKAKADALAATNAKLIGLGFTTGEIYAAFNLK